MKRACLAAVVLIPGVLFASTPAQAADRICVTNESWTFSPAVGTAYVSGTTYVEQNYTSTCTSGGLPSTYSYALAGHYYGTCTDGFIDGSINATVFAQGNLAYATNTRPEAAVHFFNNAICGRGSVGARGVTAPG